MDRQSLFNQIIGKIKANPRHQFILRRKSVLLIVLPYRMFISGYLARRSKYFKRVLKEIRGQLQQQSESIAQQWCQLQECVKLVEKSRQETAKILNHDLERHTLIPAIETVVRLYDEIIGLKIIAEKTGQEAKDFPAFKQLVRALQISARTAEDQIACLGIETIAPSDGDELDAQKHLAYHPVDTNRKELHGRVSQLFSPGLMYRGKVLRQARVSVFRYRSEKDIEIQKGE